MAPSGRRAGGSSQDAAGESAARVARAGRAAAAASGRGARGSGRGRGGARWLLGGASGVAASVACALAGVALWFWGKRKGDGHGAATAGADDLRDVFAPAPLSGSGGKVFPVDGKSQVLLKQLGYVAAKDADRLKSQLSANPLQLGARLDLCNALERNGVGRPAPEHRAERFQGLAMCYRRFMEAFTFAESLPSTDVRRNALLAMRPSAGRTAGMRMLMFADGKERRLKEAEEWLRVSLLRPDGAGGLNCTGSENECVSAFADLLLVSRMRGATEEELQRILLQAVAAPGLSGYVDWEDAWSVHLQMPQVRRQAFWDPAEVPWLTGVSQEGQLQEIQKELESYLEAKAGPGAAWSHQPNSGFLSEAATWNSVELAMNGKWNQEICLEHFPITCRILRDGRAAAALNPANFRAPGTPRKGDEAPALMANIYQALPGAKIRPHFGTPCRLVASLGLRVPDRAMLRVGRDWRAWQDGAWLVFDDSFEHEVINEAAEPRYVLALAILHPDCCADCHGH